VLDIVQNIGHSLKNLGPSQKTLCLPLCPKLVTDLVRIYLITDAIVSTLDTRLRLPTETLLCLERNAA